MEKREPLLEIKNLTKRFGGLVAVNDLSMTLEGDGIHALIGPNGAGKTTAVNMLTGVLPADEGSFIFLGEQMRGKKPYYIAQNGIRRTYQNIKLFMTLTLKENLMVGGHCKTKAGIFRTIVDGRTFRREERQLSEKAEQILELIGLKDRANEISGSQPYGVQKVSELGIAMMTDPKLIMLDEPAAGLNPSERATFIDYVMKIKEMGIKFLLIEHNMDVVMNLSETISVLNFGVKIAEGTPHDIQSNDEVIQAYLGRKYKKQG